jgi:hypothetical protein
MVEVYFCMKLYRRTDAGKVEVWRLGRGQKVEWIEVATPSPALLAALKKAVPQNATAA